jgi:hypothetical protein
LWRADRRELFFVADDRKSYAVNITDTAGSFDVGLPRYLFVPFPQREHDDGASGHARIDDVAGTVNAAESQPL